MLSVYHRYWKNSLNFSGKSPVQDLLVVLGLNLAFLAIAYLVAVLLPPSWENLAASLINLAKILIFLPAIAMVVRVANQYRK